VRPHNVGLTNSGPDQPTEALLPWEASHVDSAVTAQIVSVSLGIAGEQRGRLSAVNVGTREAELHLLWGSLMLTLTSGVQSEHLRSVWLHAGVNARRLPMARGGLRALSGIDPRLEHPGVVLRLWANPEWNVGYVGGSHPRGRAASPAHVSIRIGGLTWNAYDQTAYRSAVGILTQAARVSETTFTR